MQPIAAFMYPDSVAIVGASNDQTKRGFHAIETLLADQFKGAIYPINPKESSILGLKCYPDLQSLPASPALALICTPAKTVPELLAQCGRAGVKGAVVLGNGFSEAGQEGAALEAAAVAMARAANVRVIGPNTSGMFNTHAHCNLVGLPDLPTGHVGLISQSGNVTVSLVCEAQINGRVGFSTYVGVGNEADIRFDEYLRYLGNDPNTRVVVVYAEGFKDGRAFVDAVRDVSASKPVVIFKGGRTMQGQLAARSHTGSLAGDYRMSRDVHTQAGAIVVNRSDQILPIAETLTLLPKPNGNKVAILADGGGHATMATDVMAEQGIPLARLSEATRDRLAQILPAAAALGNPVDVAGRTDSDPMALTRCADILLSDPNVDCLLIVGMFGGFHLRFSHALLDEEIRASEALAVSVRSHGKPTVVFSAYEIAKPEPLTKLHALGVPVFSSVELAGQCVGALIQYGQRSIDSAGAPRQAAGQAACAGHEIVARARADGRDHLLEPEARRFLRANEIPIEEGVWIKSDEALDRVQRRSRAASFAMKLVSRDIQHKSDAGGVLLGLGVHELEQARKTIRDRALAYAPTARLDGVLVVSMARKGCELILGVVNDAQYGRVMMFGLGGVWVELLREVAFRTIPVTRSDAEQMLDLSKAKALFEGFRGEPPLDRNAIIDLMLRLSRLCETHPEIHEIDLNPVIVYSQGYEILDARMTLKSA
ncbi:MAG: acetate--CoA ligase family protein [Lautropia sp.]